MVTEFKTVGYSIDYLVNGKYIGSKRIEQKDREHYGYNGRTTITLTNDLILDNNKKIKAGAVVVTELFPLNGRILN